MDFDRLSPSQGPYPYRYRSPSPEGRHSLSTTGDDSNQCSHDHVTQPTADLARITFQHGAFTIETSSWHHGSRSSHPTPIKRLSSKIDIIDGPDGTLTIAHDSYGSQTQSARLLEYDQWSFIRNVIPHLHPDKAMGCTEVEAKWPMLALGRRLLEHSCAQRASHGANDSIDELLLGTDVYEMLTTMGIFRLTVTEGYGTDLSDIIIPVRRYQDSQGDHCAEILYPDQYDDQDEEPDDICRIKLDLHFFKLTYCSWHNLSSDLPPLPLRITREAAADITYSPLAGEVSILRRQRRPGATPRLLTEYELSDLAALATMLDPDHAKGCRDEEEEYWPSETLARRAMEHLEAVNLWTRAGRAAEPEVRAVREIGPALRGLISKLYERDNASSDWTDDSERGGSDLDSRLAKQEDTVTSAGGVAYGACGRNDLDVYKKMDLGRMAEGADGLSLAAAKGLVRDEVRAWEKVSSRRTLAAV